MRQDATLRFPELRPPRPRRVRVRRAGLPAERDRPCRRRRRAGRQRRLLPGAPLRPAERLAHAAPRGDRCPHHAHRSGHRRDRPALREPAPARGGGRRARPHRRRAGGAGRQPRQPGARPPRLGGLRLHRLHRPARRGHRAAEVPRLHGRGARRADGGRGPAAVPRRPAAADLPALARARSSSLVGCGHPRDRGVGSGPGREPHELDAAHRGHRRAVRRAPGRADPPLPGRVGRGRARLDAAGEREPLGVPARHRSRPPLLRPRRRARPDRGHRRVPIDVRPHVRR